MGAISIMEKWKEILSTEGYYQVSNYGNVRSVSRTVPYKDGRTRFWPSKTLTPYIGTSGYSQFDLKIAGKVFKKLGHRLVGEAFLVNAEGKKQINHKDGDKRNNHVDNLEWVDQYENMRHSFDTGAHTGIGRTHYKNKTVFVRATGKVYETVVAAAKDLELTKKQIFDRAQGFVSNPLGIQYS